jgi:hypothetical protein
MRGHRPDGYAQRVKGLPTGSVAYCVSGVLSPDWSSSIAFIKRAAYGLTGTNAIMFSRMTDAGSAICVFDPSHPEKGERTLFSTDHGFVFNMNPSFDGDRLVFSYKTAVDQPFHIWDPLNHRNTKIAMKGNNRFSPQGTINLTHPDWSPVLIHSFSQAGGGLAKDHRAIFRSKDDPKYIALLEILQEARRAFEATPRIDMVGAEPIAQERDFGRTF